MQQLFLFHVFLYVPNSILPLCSKKVKIAKVKEDLDAIGKALPTFDSSGEIVGSTRNRIPSTEISDKKAVNVNRESKVNGNEDLNM